MKKVSTRPPVCCVDGRPLVASLLSIAILAGILCSGCLTARKQEPDGLKWEVHGPFALRMPKTVDWTAGKPRGYDPNLPGYHLTGGVGSVRIAPSAPSPRDHLVLAITPGHNQPPHLDHFRLTVRGGHLETQPFNPDVPIRVSWTGREVNTFMYAEKGTYFDFKVVDKAVHVHFKPDVMELLQGECIIFWIDRYE